MWRSKGAFVRSLIGITVLWCSVLYGQGNGRIITLDEASEIALENNATLKAARYHLKSAKYSVLKSRFDLLPKVDLQLNYTRLDPATVRRGNVFVDVGRALVDQFGTGDPNDIRPGAYDNNFSTLVQIVQPIYNGGANWAAISAARALEDQAGYTETDVEQQVILDVKRYYLRALQAAELVTLAKKNLMAAQEHLGNSQKMLDVGLRSRTDVLRWEVQKANSEGQLIESENGLKMALAVLKQVMGMPYSDAFALSPLGFKPVPLDSALPRQLEKSNRNHPGLQAAMASVDAQRAGVRLAWAAFQPKINFVYQHGWEQNNTLALDSFSYWTAGVSVNIPLFHSFSNYANLQQSKADLRHLEERQEEAKQLLGLQVIRARLNVETALKKYHIAGKAQEQAAENLRILDNSYKVGLAANIDVLDAQVILTKAEADLIAARYNYWIARAELDRAMGVLSQ